MIDQTIQSIKHFFSATSFLRKHQLMHYYIYPIILCVVYYLLLISSIKFFSEYLLQHVFNDYLTPIDKKIEGFWSFLSFFSIKKIAMVLTWLISFMLTTKFSKYVILILLSPVFAFLSEKVDEKLTGKQYPFDLFQLIKDVFRGVLIALRNLTIELFLIAILTLSSFFAGPLAILLVPVLWLISSYFYGFSMMDYTSERRKYSISNSVQFVRKNKGIALGNGMMYSVFDMIPVVGIVFAPINAVVGATISIIEKEKSITNTP